MAQGLPLLRCEGLVGGSAKLMWLAIRFALRAAGHYLLAPLRALWAWLTADWRHGPLFFLALLAAAHIFIIDPNLRGERDEAQRLAKAESEAHAGTIRDFVAASHKAEQRQQANKARVEAEQKAITERIAHDYETRLAALRVRVGADAVAGADRLRAGPAKVDPRASGRLGVPGDADAARGAAAPPGDHGLSLARQLIASEQALQLDALIDWVIAQAHVKTSPVPEPAP